MLPSRQHWRRPQRRRRLHRDRASRSSRVALLALGGGLSQGIGVVAGYMTGTEARVLAVFVLVSVTFLIAFMPSVLQSPKKNPVLAQSLV